MYNGESLKTTGLESFSGFFVSYRTLCCLVLCRNVPVSLGRFVAGTLIWQPAGRYRRLSRAKAKMRDAACSPIAGSPSATNVKRSLTPGRSWCTAVNRREPP